ncbi:protein-disulfide reductase DsbD family protein [Flavobacterium crassostreae]|uniref:Thiol:disulfide interchange protein n=1 Tax=Flavobacterium crassostreae TaxID=1763534 RepID=A0A1B9DKH7_9FLAO|nr:cytochrome c biogenesis protein CcdA [Flavobacterium crassostreae]OCB70191.1 thiol:disulfide interchange protein [Flavobacterium crassostreae]
MTSKHTFLLLALLAFVQINAQILDPAKWTTKVEQKQEQTYILVLDAVIEKDWHLYSQFTPDGGPLALEVVFKNQKENFSLIGKAKESKTKTAYNDVFEVNETFFENRAQITQEIKVTNPSLTKVEVVLNYQVCKQVCINQQKKFTFVLPTQKGSSALIPDTKTTLQEASATTQAEPIVLDTATTTYAFVPDTAATAAVVLKNKKTPSNTMAATSQQKGLWTIFFIAFFSGFAALLTPCVFPMIPMTVSFFTKKSKTKAQGIRNAMVYGLAIIVIYVMLGFLVTWIFGADALNALSTNVWFNILFFVLLITFAASFLGAFEIMLPNSWANKVDNQADRGGLIGILFMALALAIVSFSCTGPIVGTLLVEAASKGGIAPIVGMFGFSLALALPFMFFAMFPGWLQSLPKSGGWLNTVKVFLGFLELALAFKFLSNADLVLQLHLLEREVFLAIWIAIFGTLAFYLFGKITLPHDSPLTHISVGRLAMGLVVLTFTIYLIPGLWGAPLKIISAFPPPLTYSESPMGLGSSARNTIVELPEGATSGPHGIVVFEDYDKGLAYAKAVNKPIMLDFTGYACVNCRKMENNVWSNATVLKLLKNEVVVVSLYVDDKRELPKAEQFISNQTAAEIVTVGDKWTDFMISKYQTNTQPLYVLTDLEGNSLNTTTPTISYVGLKEYTFWLQAGISEFKSK